MIEIRKVSCNGEIVELPFAVHSQSPVETAEFDVIKALVARINDLEKMEAK